MKRLLLTLLVLLVVPTPAEANPRPFPFTYHYATSAEGALEVEQYLDFIPVRVSKQGPTGTEAVTSARMSLETEFELGLTDHLELGWYFVFQQAAGSTVQPLNVQGLKQRLRFRFAESGDWPVDVGLYLEFAEFHNEFEIEEKLLLEKRFGAWRAAANLWFEHEYYFQTPEWAQIYNPTLAVGYEFSPAVLLGVEAWARGRFDRPFAASNHYVGPTVRLAKGQYWLSAGLYTKVDDLGEQLPVDGNVGRIWLRTLVGIGL